MLVVSFLGKNVYGKAGNGRRCSRGCGWFPRASAPTFSHDFPLDKIKETYNQGPPYLQ
jgi:hypothetical protein